MRKKVAALLWLSLCLQSYAQSPAPLPAAAADVAKAPVEKPEDVLARGQQIYAEQGARTALPVFEQALTLFRASGDRHGEALALGMMGNCYRQLGNLPKSLEMHRASLALKQDLGDKLEEGKTLNNIGLVYSQMAQYVTAVEYYLRAIKIFQELNQPKFEGAVHNNLGLAQHQMGEFQSSLAEFNRALDLYRDTNFDRGIGDAIGNIGLHYLDLGHFAEALKNYQDAFAVSERIKSDSAMSLDLGNMALCYSGLGQIDQALRAFDRAETLARDAGLKKEEADWQKGKGSALVQLGRYDAALAQFKNALETYEKATLQRELVDALGDLGQLHLVLGDSVSAEKDFQHALDISREISHPRGVMQSLVALGDIEAHHKRFTEAVVYYRQAIAKAQEVNEQTTLANGGIQLALAYRQLGKLDAAAGAAAQAEEVARATGAPSFVSGAEYALGEVTRARGALSESLRHFTVGEQALQGTFDAELNWRLAFARGQVLEQLKRDDEALAAYRRAISVIEDIRNQLSERRFRSGYIEDKYQVYVAIVELLLRLRRLDQAFEFAERLRARSFLDLLNAGVPVARSPEQIQRELALREEIRKLQKLVEVENSKVETEPKRTALGSYSAELAKAERAYQNFLDDLLPSDPAYAGARLERVLSGQDVQKMLSADTALIEYVIGENQITIFLLRAGKLQARAMPVKSEALRAKVELVNDLIGRGHGDEWRPAAHSLYQLLVQPVQQAGGLEGVKRLYLVPHGILHYVPFAVLPTSAETTRLLIEDYELAYLPAAAALATSRYPEKVAESALALAPAFSRLPYAQEEARTVAGAFPRHARLLLGTQATKPMFESLARHYKILHLATHGFFNRNNPLLSGVMLEPDASGEGQLEVHEILGLHLDAHLVTLSACETALGGGYFSDVPPGDDLVSLTRAFLFAGSSSVIATLWEVSDRSTMELMRDFYPRLRNMGRASALAAVQRQMRHSPGRFSHPYFWGAFVLVGQMD